MADDPRIQNAHEVLRRLGRGQTMLDMADALEKASERARATGKKTRLTLTIDFERLTNDEDAAGLRLSANVTTRVPAVERGSTIVFIQPDGTLGGSNPAQAEMFAAPKIVPTTRGLSGTADEEGVVTSLG